MKAFPFEIVGRHSHPDGNPAKRAANWIPACLENRRSKTTTEDKKSTNTGRAVAIGYAKGVILPSPGVAQRTLRPSWATAIPKAIAKTRKSESTKGKENQAVSEECTWASETITIFQLFRVFALSRFRDPLGIGPPPLKCCVFS